MRRNMAILRLAVVLVVVGTFNLTIAQESKESGLQQVPVPAAQQPSALVPSQSSPGQGSPGQSRDQDQASQPVPLPGPSLKVKSRMVLVDAVVTDKSGKPVTGLKASDFEILENGEPQAIRAFTAREPALEDSVPPVRRTLPPGLFTNIPDIHSEDGPPIVVLIDSLNTEFDDQSFMQDQVIKFFKKFSPRHNVAIYLLGIRLRLVQDFTSDPQELQAAVAKMSGRFWILNNGHELWRRSFLPPLAAQFGGEDLEHVKSIERSKITTEALKQIARNVSGYPGRRNLIWLSGSFQGFSSDLANPFMGRYLDQARETVNIFNVSQTAVYPVDVRGLAGSFMPDATSDGFTGGDAGQQLLRYISLSSARLQSLHAYMNQLANQTGGRAFYNRNDIDHAIALSFEDGSTYYSFGYYPANKNWDGKFRKIEIRMLAKDLRVRHRPGYFAKDAPLNARAGTEEEMRSEFHGAMELESPISTTLPFGVQVNLPTVAQPDVVVNFGVDPHAVSFDLQADQLRHAKVDFVVLAYDGNGKVVADKVTTLTASLKPGTYDAIMHSSLRAEQHMNLAPGKYRLRIGVRDQRSNFIGTVLANLEVPEKAKAVPAVAYPEN
ncbi:MAG TPA: VWA domain-containing protein [Candidatus Angelobacter sp.]|nr:VWA domain-containing protein [Candidatus Angelobacter sp.]